MEGDNFGQVDLNVVLFFGRIQHQSCSSETFSMGMGAVKLSIKGNGAGVGIGCGLTLQGLTSTMRVQNMRFAFFRLDFATHFLLG